MLPIYIHTHTYTLHMIMTYETDTESRAFLTIYLKNLNRFN